MYKYNVYASFYVECVIKEKNITRRRITQAQYHLRRGNKAVLVSVVSKSGNPGPGPVPKNPDPNSYFLYYIFIKALILIKFENNA